MLSILKPFRILSNIKKLESFTPSLAAFSFLQTANFSKYISKARTKRLPLTTKRVGKGYYKGNRSRKEGHITSISRFIKDPRLCTELVMPDLTNCKLKAYVGPGAKRHETDVVVKLDN